MEDKKELLPLTPEEEKLEEKSASQLLRENEAERFKQATKEMKETFQNVDKNAGDLMVNLLEAHTEFTAQLMHRDAMMQNAVEMLVSASVAIEDFKNIGHSLILKLQKREMELLIKTLEEQDGQGVKLIFNRLEYPTPDEDGNFQPGAHFKGELRWAQVEENGIMIYIVAPDTLTGISFSKIPVSAFDAATAMMAFDKNEDRPMFRFISTRTDAHHQNTNGIDIIDDMDKLEERLQFVQNNDIKREKIFALIESMKKNTGFELLGLNIEEVQTKLHRASAEQETEDHKFTSVIGIFRRFGEIQRVEDGTIQKGFHGSLIQEEWILDENTDEIMSRSVASANNYNAPEADIATLIFVLGELVAPYKAQLLAKHKGTEEVSKLEEITKA